ncbi:MAG: DUF2612 domain-containing protein [Candidatus Saccharimonadales bacterium]
MSVTTADALALFTSQYQGKPNLVAWATALTQPFVDVAACAEGMVADFALANATGAQLDVLGALVGAQRNVGFELATGGSLLDDAHFGILIQATIARNQWDGTIPAIYALWTAIFGSSSVLQIIDGQNMTMQAVATGLEDQVSQQLVSAGLIIPTPMAVALTIIEQTTLAQQAYLGILVSGRSDVTLSVPAPTKHIAFVSAAQVAPFYTASAPGG